jgi:outer membrane protein assembly factor BamB
MVITDFSADMQGVFTSALYDTSGYITGGSTDGKMLIMSLGKTGTKLWEKIIDPGFKIDQTQLLKIENGNFLAIGSASPDTTYDFSSGLLFMSFDSNGQILKELEYISGYFVACYEAALDNSGNIYLALTRKEALAEPRATVAKFNNSLQLLWEQELANNPTYGAAALAIIHGGSGKVFVAGRTELPAEGGIMNNSFVASITDAGSLKWKKYPENSNTGTGLLLNSAGELTLLNINCFIVNLLDPVEGEDGGRIRMFDVCDPYNTDALASDFDVDFNNDLILAGSIGGSFYLAVKPLQ